MNGQDIRLESERLLLRRPGMADVPDIVSLLSDPDMAPYTLNIPFPYSQADALDWVGMAERGWASGKGATCAVLRREDGVYMGAVGLRGMEGEPELGYWLGKPYWGRGYATEAARRLVAFAFGHPHLPAVRASHHPDNPASARVLEKLGFVHVGDGELSSTIRGKLPARLYRLSRANWEAQA